ncbi:putative ubiquitin-protein ligase-like [Trypanosoma rangeli]|uniref:Putative ubiquitin-protein ligase-like n=1 Tax=Trypanosoma rangeli TaxID=5698 RepID=A0A3R7K4B6_TRYRA|nr:putative ubiquitin-protein ligase-like [Trypanosoma rangeli]RNF00264.1 putative ubiquitin-protein ligase-like [Trypanosoma rangeli]|eukprot:RNF00264.1 putative ubiquitin-protein ligase-like [Trypanosoma rangeli]
MFLPSASLLPLSAEPPTKGNWCDTSLIGLLINGPRDFCANSSTLMKPRWRLVGEVYRWMSTLQGWDRMRELQALLPPGPHNAAQRFLLLEHLINDLLCGEGKGAVPGTGEHVRVGKVFKWYEEVCRGDLALRTPQLLLPLARALCRASLLDLLSELVRNTFCDLWSRFQAPQPPLASQLLLEALLFYSTHHGLVTTQMRLGGDAEVLAELSPAAYDGARGMVTAFAETYILALWQHD